MKQSWQWSRNYRVWEADRSVFLYPENWLEPEMRLSPRTQVELSDVTKVAHGQRTSLLLTAATPPATVLAGRALAEPLGRNLFRVDLTHVVSKFAGETEKNIDQVFDAAARSTTVLLLDEADALFGKRSGPAGGNDRFDNAEMSCLLRRIEGFDGLAALATHSTRKTVEPLWRRFLFVIDPVAVD